jgi:sigma-B regulation protein RsbU (phosphoserine phosphatase)
MTIRMAYEMVMPYHLHMPSYFLETFTEYPSFNAMTSSVCLVQTTIPYNPICLAGGSLDKKDKIMAIFTDI